MVEWHRSRVADIGLRAGGLFLCTIAYAAVSHLFASARARSGGDADLLAFVLAVIGFLCGNAGGAMACLGRCLFEEIEVRARWRLSDGDVTPIGECHRNIAGAPPTPPAARRL